MMSFVKKRTSVFARTGGSDAASSGTGSNSLMSTLKASIKVPRTDANRAKTPSIRD